MKKKTLIVLGVNSGTSADGLDLVLLRLGARAQGRLSLKTLGQRTVSYPSSFRTCLLELAEKQQVSLEELALTDEALGDFIGHAALRFIRRTGAPVDLIASHGQTIRHLPQSVEHLGTKVNATLQIGAPERIAHLAQSPVVSHFRQAHTAIGGEDAPITTGAVYHALRNPRDSRLLINIGGIANLFYVPATGHSDYLTSFDVGPGNALLDLASEEMFGLPFDRNGRLAASGKISHRLLTLLSGSRFFRQSATRSTGREQYGRESFLRIKKLAGKLKLDGHDLLATLAELTALKIAAAVRPFQNGDSAVKALYLSGGGARNRYLVRRLKDSLPGMLIASLQELGYHPDYFEATCFAILGYNCVRSHPSAPPETPVRRRSAKRTRSLAPILGRITQPPALIRSGAWRVMK
ncbi:MAG: anhydro-N-acetylmuramic acid kinase [Candidatus Zixiibacteriota bacterium]